MNSIRYSPNQPRATIVLDTNTITHLSRPVPRQYLNRQTNQDLHNFIDILPFLAQHGYRILIPEAVAFNAGRVFADGHDMTRLFNNPDLDPNLHLARTFLKQVGRGDFLNISIVSNTGPVQTDMYCRELRTAYDGPGKVSRDMAGKLFSSIARRRAILDLIEANKHIAHDEQSVASVVHSERMQQPTAPVYVLTNNGRLQTHHTDAHFLRHRNFMHLLVASGVAQAAGFAADVDADTLAKEVFFGRTHTETGQRQFNLQFSPEGTTNFLSERSGINARFLETLTSLKTELDAAPTNLAPQPVAEKPADYHQTAAAKRLAAFSLGSRSSSTPR